MHSFNQLNYRNLFAGLGDKFSAQVKPEPLQNAKIISVNHQVAKYLDLELNEQHQQLKDILACQWLPEKSLPLASVYSGHQFGQYNPQLGDGRALLMGQIENSHGELWELQLKGSGLTPFSRMGDGRAVLRSSIREYLCSAAMQGLGIATTQALAIATSDTPVYRESIEKGASILRMAPSHVRFGHFEYFFYTKQHIELKQLTDFVIEHHFSEYVCLSDDEKYAAFLTEVVKRTATMIAHWQAQGFSHGVMNTDNMSILGLTIDYGPFGFMDDFNPGFICNHSDHHGRYAYNQQVNIGLWNLNALAHSLSPLISVDAIKQALGQYEQQYIEVFSQLMRSKLGLFQALDEDNEIIQALLQLMANERIDYSYFFRQFSHFVAGKTADIRDHFINREVFDAWYANYRQRLNKDNEHNQEDRLALMLAHNPKFILRNYLAQQAIDDANQGDYRTLNNLLQVLQSPFSEHSELEEFAKLPPEWGKKLEVSCSS